MPQTWGQLTKWRRRVALRSPQAWRPVKMKRGYSGGLVRSSQTPWTGGGDGSPSISISWFLVWSASADPPGFSWPGPAGGGGCCCTRAAPSCRRKASHDALGFIQAARWRGGGGDGGGGEEQLWRKTDVSLLTRHLETQMNPPFSASPSLTPRPPRCQTWSPWRPGLDLPR